MVSLMTEAKNVTILCHNFTVKIIIHKIITLGYVNLSYIEKYQWLTRGRARTVKEQVIRK